MTFDFNDLQALRDEYEERIQRLHVEHAGQIAAQQRSWEERLKAEVGARQELIHELTFELAQLHETHAAALVAPHIAEHLQHIELDVMALKRALGLPPGQSVPAGSTPAPVVVATRPGVSSPPTSLPPAPALPTWTPPHAPAQASTLPSVVGGEPELSAALAPYAPKRKKIRLR